MVTLAIVLRRWIKGDQKGQTGMQKRFESYQYVTHLLTGASLGIPIHGFRSPVAEPMDE